MLKKSIDYKLLLLRICLYIIIIILCGTGIDKIYTTYQAIHNINSEDINGWLNRNNYKDIFIKTDHIKLKWRVANLYFTIEDLSLKLPAYKSSVMAKEISGKINILSAILNGKINIKNLLVKNLNVIVNDIDIEKTTTDLKGKLEINTIFSKKSTSLNVNASLTKLSLGDAVTVNIDTIINIDSIANKIFINKFRLQNTVENIREVIEYLPEYAISPLMLNWLDRSVLAGSIGYSDLFWNNEGVLAWKIKFKDIKLQYADGWPPIEHLYANMDLIDDNLTIELDPSEQKSFILQQPIKKLKAKLNNVVADQLEPLEIQAEIVAPVHKGIEFLRKSDLPHLDKHLTTLPSTNTGNMDLTLRLLIPVDNEDTTSSIIFSGNCKLSKANLKVIDLDLGLLNLSGDIKFSNNYFSSQNIQVNIFNTNVNANFVLDNNLLFVESPELFKVKLILDQHKKINNDKSDITMEELSLFGNSLGKVRLIKHHGENKLNFSGTNASGALLFNNSKLADYSIELNELKLITGNKNNHQDLNNINLLSRINRIQLNCKSFYLNDSNFGEINGVFVKDQLSPQHKDLIYRNIFELKLSGMDLNVHGEWLINKSNHSTTNITGDINTKDFGNTLRNFHSTKKIIQKGQGIINFNLNWPSYPFGFELSNIIGIINVDLKQGIVVGIEPGLGRVIGLLSIENIQRRLSLDFSDITKSGFSFDQLTGKLNINKGDANVDHVIIQGPSAKMMITGKIMLIPKNLDLLIEVDSKIGATLPLAAALAAGNPAVGAAIWLFDKATGAKVSAIKAKKYKVTGTLDNPQIAESQ